MAFVWPTKFFLNRHVLCVHIYSYTPIRHNDPLPKILLFSFLLPKQPWPGKTPPDPSTCALVSGTKMLAADPLSPPWIGLVWTEIWWNTSNSFLCSSNFLNHLCFVADGILTGANKLWSSVYSDTFTFFSSFSFSSLSAGSNHRGQLSLPHAWKSLCHPWPCRWFTPVPSLDRFSWPLQMETPHKSAVLEICPFFRPQILMFAHFSSIKTTLRTECSLAP